MTDSIYSNLRQLGGETRIPASPEEAELERVAAHPGLSADVSEIVERALAP